MKTHRTRFCLLIFFLFAAAAPLTPALAIPGSDSRLFYADGSLSLGYSQPRVVYGTYNPKLLQVGAGLTLGVFPPFLSPVFLGATTDYRIVGQYSAIDPDVGNFSGYRWNIVSPTVGISLFRLITLKVDFQFLGNYKLLKLTEAKESLEYKEPRGLRGTILVTPFGSVIKPHVGLFYEYVAFNKHYSTSLGERKLSQKLELWQFGATLGFSI